MTALRAFDAVARHKSFTRAANDLSVTPGALSLQVKNLEEELGANLFIRSSKAVELTQEGKILFDGTSSSFKELQRCWRDLLEYVGSDRLSLTAGPAFVSKWLAPKLGAFTRQHPEMELQITASLEVMDLAANQVDLAIRFSRHVDSSLFSEELLEELIVPLMRPELANRIKSPEDLLNETLIQDTSLDFLEMPPSWKDWMKAQGIETEIRLGPKFNQADHAIDMAVQGTGVLLGRYTLAYDAVRMGALCTPLPFALSVAPKFWVVCATGEEDRPKTQAVRAWLKTEADGTRKSISERGFEVSSY